MKDEETVLTIPCPSTEDPSVERRYFGELALLYDAPRAASVKAVGRVKLWALDRTTFKSILQQSDDIKMMLYSKFVQSIHLFRDLKLSQVNALCASLQAQDFDDGDTIFKQGDDGDAFYIVESGEAACLKDGVVVSIVHEGDYFGELALVRREPRAATVRAKGKLSVLKIGARAFKRLIGVLEFDKVY
jgi:cAMP-dependent protein kinase regulator